MSEQQGAPEQMAAGKGQGGVGGTYKVTILSYNHITPIILSPNDITHYITLQASGITLHFTHSRWCCGVVGL